jgi:hypothetical protein
MRRCAWTPAQTKHGFGVVGTGLKYILQKRGVMHTALFRTTGRKIADLEGR